MTTSRRAAALLAVALVVVPGTAARAQGECGELPKPTGYVVDEAEVVDDPAERAVAARLSSFEASTEGRQVAVLVVGSIGDDAIEDYANDVFDCWGVGAKDDDTGVLLVIAIEQRRLRIEVGRGLEGELTDVQAADIVRDVITPHLRSGDYTSGVRDGVEAIVRVLGGGDIGQPLTPTSPAPPRGPNPLLLLGLLFGAFTLMSFVGGGRRRGRGGGVFFPPVIIGGGGLGGGGFGGGGGGFGGFGGGGSGGGGASGGW